MADYALYLLVRFQVFLFRLLPFRFSLWIGRRFGDIINSFIGKRKAIAYSNLKAAFGGRYSIRQLNGIIRRLYQNLSQSYVELLKFPLLGEDYVNKYIKIEGEEKIARALEEESKGVILLTAHFGNWELASLVGSLKGYRMNVLARWQKFERLNGYLNMMRASRGAKVIFKKEAREEVLRALRNNEVVGILSDQDGGRRGEFVEFFGRFASMQKGVAYFSLKTLAPVFPVFIIRERGPYHRIIIKDDISVTPSSDMKRDIHEISQRFANMLESYVNKYPDQWLWLHKRWKSTPSKRILIVSDGKAGHLKQSRAVADMIKGLRAEAGYEPRDTIIDTVEVKFLKRFGRLMFDIGVILGFNTRQLSFCLSKDSYGNIEASYGDYIISCGASTSGVCLSLKKELNAKAVGIMRPNLHSIKNFNLTIIPAHDAVSRRLKNVVWTKGAVTGLNKDTLLKRACEIKQRFNVISNKVIGVLIGGDSKAYTLEPFLIKEILDEILEAAESIGADILITTSRRTPADVTEEIKRRLDGVQRVKLLLIANENNFEGAVEGILGLSDVLVVSGESIAMVTEAISVGKKPVVFMPRKKRRFLKTKQEISVRLLSKEGLLTLPENNRHLRESILEAAEQRPSPASMTDTDAITDALKRII